MAKNHLFDNISNAQTEEELKFHFAKFFNLPFNTKNRKDIYTEQILFEFKLNDNLKIRAKVIAQALYYVRRMKLGDYDSTPSENVCIVTKNFAAIFHTTDFADFYTKNTYDWDLKPSSPCKKQITDKNFYQVFQHWKNFFGEAVKNGHKASEYFITDIEQGKTSLVDFAKKAFDYITRSAAECVYSRAFESTSW